MSENSECEYFHIVTRQSQAAEIVVHLPSFCKPLAASVRPYGSGEGGLLASYYDPEQHAWIVRQLPLHESWPHRPPPLLVVRVVTLVDPANFYELRVALASVLDGIDNDTLYALQRRSQLYTLLAEEHMADTSDATLQTAAAQGQLPHLREAISLAAPLEVMEGFVLTGGGFSSDFPVLREGPALPRSMDSVYDDVLAGGAFCGPPLPGSGASTSGGAARGEDGGVREYTAWSVTAAANAGLACFSLGLRRRSPLEVAQQQQHESRFGGPDAQETPQTALVAKERERENATQNMHGASALSWMEDPSVGPAASASDPTGLVASRSASDIGVALRSTTASSAVGGPRPLLETLTLRGEVEVKLARKDGEKWQISLPSPHGSFSFAMGPNRELMTVARRTFYCE